MAVCQNLVPLVNIKIASKWMFIPLKMVLIGIDPSPYIYIIVSLYITLYNNIIYHPDVYIYIYIYNDETTGNITGRSLEGNDKNRR